MINLLLLLPLLLPLFGGIFCFFFSRKIMVQQVLGIVFQLAMVLVAAVLLWQVQSKGILHTPVGNWPVPFGISLVADLFSSLMVLAGSVTGLAVLIYSYYGLDHDRQGFGYYPLLLMLQAGVAGACLTGDLFNLFVWFEVMLICCFVLITLGGTKAQLEGSVKYVTINFLASCLLLMGVGIVYSFTGTLNLARIAVLVQEPGVEPGLVTMAAMFFLVAFGIKAAIFPLFFWLPASYHTPPIAISAFMAGLLTKVGIYALVRLFTLIFSVRMDFIQPLLLFLAGATMIVGVLGAASQSDFRRILSFHIVSQIGYMLMGLAIFTPLAIAGAIFFIVHNILVKTNLFLISGVVAHRHGTFALKKLGGVYLQQPVLAVVFAVSAFSLAGIPPLSGFWGKFMLARAGLEAGNYLVVGASLAVSIITLFSMTKIWNEVFWKVKPAAVLLPGQEPAPAPDMLKNRLLYIPVVLLALCILIVGLHAEPLIRTASGAARNLMNSEIYTNAVLSR